MLGVIAAHVLGMFGMLAAVFGVRGVVGMGGVFVRVFLVGMFVVGVLVVGFRARSALPARCGCGRLDRGRNRHVRLLFLRGGLARAWAWSWHRGHGRAA